MTKTGNKIEVGIGNNRTGIGTAPLMSREMIEEALRSSPTPAVADGEAAIRRVRDQYALDHEPLGTMPLPTSLKGVAQTAVAALKGQRPTLLLDRLGDRLAFERTGMRLYEALLDKFDAVGSWEGGPTRAEIVEIQRDEARHFELLREAIEAQGADPTAITPSADVSGVEAMGVMQVLGDPRTTLPQALHAILTIELVDNESWQLLVSLANHLRHADLAARMEDALRDEQHHLIQVRRWLHDEARLAADSELGATK